MESLLDTLRQKTSKLHHALHVHPVLKSCQEGTMSKSEYIYLLKAFYSPWKILIPAIDLVPVEALKPKLRKRATAIQDDLKKLNIPKDRINKCVNNIIFSFIVYNYKGRHNNSRKAIEIKIENILKILNIVCFEKDTVL